jgi:hypothetical protein
VSSESSRQVLVEEEVTRVGSSSSFEIKFWFVAGQSAPANLLFARKARKYVTLLNNRSGYFWKLFCSKIEVSTWF